MQNWEYMCLKGSLNALQSTLQYTYGSDHDAIMKALIELNHIIKNLENFDREDDK